MHSFRLGWASDLHWDFVNPDRRSLFLQSLADQELSALVVTGDLATRRRLPAVLQSLDQLGMPIYFTTGNHDYYTGSFVSVDEELRTICAQSRNLKRLGLGEIIHLTPEVALVGHAGWADGLAGIGAATSVTMNDSWLIKDLTLSKEELFQKLRRLGEISAEYMAKILPVAARQANRVIVATHVPPFSEVCLYEGKLASGQHLPHYVNQSMGEALLSIAREHPRTQFEILCGHTHQRISSQVRANLKVRVAGAEPCFPRLETVLEF
jgi:UDP-2,3-diacylglucosamine pyrophosphatase LpxH